MLLYDTVSRTAEHCCMTRCHSLGNTAVWHGVTHCGTLLYDTVSLTG